jgi:hypothetical protein
LESEIVSKSLNKIPITTDEIKYLVATADGSGQIKLHPESLGFENITSLQQMKPDVNPVVSVVFI